MSFAPVIHPDPGWWKRSPMSSQPTASDLCDQCGHIRELHGGGGCAARSTALIGNPSPCMCLGGNVYRRPIVVEKPR